MDDWLARLRSAGAALRCTRAEAAALAVLLAGTVAGLGLAWWLARPEPPPEPHAAGGGARTAPTDGPAAGGDDDAGAAPEGGEAFAEGDAVLVHVAGQVAEPGVVEVPAGSRVADAIDAAGGAAPDADLSVVNLARVVEDGEQIVVAHRDDADASGSSGAVGPDGRLDVNRADRGALEEVPGIGPVTAQRILAHREEHGPFTSEQELLEVPGIGERTLDRLVEHLRW